MSEVKGQVPLPDANSFPREISEKDPTQIVCEHCKRPEEMLLNKPYKHILGCAFRTRYEVIFNWNIQKGREASILDLNL